MGDYLRRAYDEADRMAALRAKRDGESPAIDTYTRADVMYAYHIGYDDALAGRKPDYRKVVRK